MWIGARMIVLAHIDEDPRIQEIVLKPLIVRLLIGEAGSRRSFT
jgi:hypothetical protein